MGLDKKIEELKNIYLKTEIPKDLDSIIDNCVKKGELKMKGRKINKWIKGCGIAAAGFLIFVVTLNTVPVLAGSMNNIPVIGKLVKILQLKEDKGQSGIVTDGSNVNLISLLKENNTESMIINFNNTYQETAPHYQIEYKKYPYSMSYTISGVRGFSAEKYFDILKQSNLILDAYKIITLDDSTVRFTVVFKKPVKYQVKEYKEPAQIAVILSEDKTSDAPLYCIRSLSYPFSEELGALEESFDMSVNRRILKDEKDTFLIDFGYFSTKEEAEAKLKEITNKFNVKLFIEKRDAAQIPKQLLQ